MVGDQCEQRAKGVFAVVQRSRDGLHSTMLLGHRQQPGGKSFSSENQLHLSLVLELEVRVKALLEVWMPFNHSISSGKFSSSIQTESGEQQQVKGYVRATFRSHF